MKIAESIRKAAPAVLIVGIVALGVTLTNLTFAASGSLTLSPSSSTATVGSNLVLTLHENSGTDAAIGVDAVINYPSSQLQFVSASTVSPFSVAPPDSASGGVLQITRGAYSGQTGDKVVTVITFKVLSAGTASITFNASQSSISPASGTTDLLTNSPGGTYSLKAPVSSTPVTPKPTSSQPTPATTAPNGSSKSTSVTVTPSSTNSGTTVPNEGTVAVSTPITVEPATVQTEGVKKVEYYLNDKLVATKTTAPYAYSVDTTKLKNGTYTLKTKTYYTNGSIKNANQKLLVKNAKSKSNTGLIYSALILLVVVSVFIIIIHKRRHLKVANYAVVDNDKIVTSQASEAKAKTDMTEPTKPTAFLAESKPAAVASPEPSDSENPHPSSLQPPAPGTVIQHTTEDKN